MILGIGTDLANIERIAGVLERHGDRFRNRVFTDTEQAKAKRRKDEAGTYAKRWAAKEACSKALGTGLRMGISWKDMAVSKRISPNQNRGVFLDSRSFHAGSYSYQRILCQQWYLEFQDLLRCRILLCDEREQTP